MSLDAAKVMYAELNIVCVIIMLILARKLRISSKSIEQSFLSLMLGSLSAMFLLDAFWVVINGNPAFPPPVNYVTNIFYFTVTAIAPYIAVCYLRVTLTNTTFSLRQHFCLQIPAFVILILSAVSVKTGWVFSVDDGNTYCRGPLFIFQAMIPLLYMVIASVITFRLAVKSNQKTVRQRGLLLSGMAILPVIGAVLEVIFPELAVVSAAMTVTMVAIIFNFQQRQITKDTLTQLSNRYDLMLYLEDQLQTPVNSDGQLLYVLFADIDYFKSINDNFGHLEGDHALCYVADALRSVSRTVNAYPARISGDEFVVVFRSDNDRGAEALIQTVQDTVAKASAALPYRLSMSAGYTACSPEHPDDPSVLLDRADANLYEAKKSRPSAAYILRRNDGDTQPASADAG